jgi:hypothetical protein
MSFVGMIIIEIHKVFRRLIRLRRIKFESDPREIGPPCGIPNIGSAQRNSTGQAFHRAGAKIGQKGEAIGMPPFIKLLQPDTYSI